MSIKDKYIASLVSKMSQVLDAWYKLHDGEWNDSDEKSLFFLVHNMSASASMHELHNVSVQAKRLEQQLIIKDYLSAETIDAIDELSQVIWAAQKQSISGNNKNND